MPGLKGSPPCTLPPLLPEISQCQNPPLANHLLWVDQEGESQCQYPLPSWGQFPHCHLYSGLAYAKLVGKLETMWLGPQSCWHGHTRCCLPSHTRTEQAASISDSMPVRIQPALDLLELDLKTFLAFSSFFSLNFSFQMISLASSLGLSKFILWKSKKTLNYGPTLLVHPFIWEWITSWLKLFSTVSSQLSKTKSKIELSGLGAVACAGAGIHFGFKGKLISLLCTSVLLCPPSMTEGKEEEEVVREPWCFGKVSFQKYWGYWWCQ